MERIRSDSRSSYQFTPGAERAFEFAEIWESREASREIYPPDLLCGLLAEPECRGALLLAACGVDEPAVLARWPEMCHSAGVGGGRHKQFSAQVQAALSTAFDWLSQYEQPVLLATEHLLLGLAAMPGEVADWLAERGLDAKQLEAEVRRLAGHDPGPLPLEPDEVDVEPDGETTRFGERADAVRPAGTPDVGEAALETESGAGEAPTPSPPFSAPPAPTAGAERPAEQGALAGGERHMERERATERERQIDREPGGERERVRERDRAAERSAVWRVIDAAANRAGEGFRVVEDYVRFVLDDRRLTGEVKQLRHDLAAMLAGLHAPARHAARDVSGDVGTSISTPAEQTRATPRDVAMASCKRAQQSLRSLEEYAKIVAPAAAAAFERLRYRSYTLEQRIALAGTSRARLADARLCVIVDGQPSSAQFAALVDTLARAEVDMIQLRDKTLSDRELLQRAAALSAAAKASGALFIMNDRADLAALAGADGVHVGQDDLTVAEARAIVGPDSLVGVSTHSLEQATRAALDGADYIGVGPTFPSQTKQFAAFPGLELVRAVAQTVSLPAFAIGGVHVGNVEQVIAAGLGRVALSAAVTRAADPLAAARAIKRALCGD